jgi:hypothetical protein
MNTASVYLILAALTLFALRRDDGRAAVTLAVNFAVSATLAETFNEPPQHDAILILCDLSVVYGMRFWCSGAQSYAIGIIGLSVILLRTAHIGGLNVGGNAYAAAINLAFGAQLLIAGGAANGIGRWLGHWADRFVPRLSGLFRHVAG